MVVASSTLPDLNGMDADALRALVLTQHAELLSRNTEIEHLKLLILKLKRMRFGRKSEKLDRQIEQLELRLEDLESGPPENIPPAPPIHAAAVPTPRKPARRPLPPQLPRETQTLAPAQSACPDCGGKLTALGEDVSETLEYVPAQFKVIRTVRPKLSCASCDRIVQQPAPSRPIDHGLAGPGLLAHVLVSKYSEHLPLYRQTEIYERGGVELERSTLADWVGGASRLLEPLVAAARDYVLSTVKVHGDDTPVPVLAPGNGKTKIGRLWTYVRDDRPAGQSTAPAVWFAYSPDRKGDHPQQHLGSRASCRQTVTRGLIGSMRRAAFRKPGAGLIFGARCMTSRKHTHRRWRAKLWSGSASCTRSRPRSGAAHPMSGGKYGRLVRGHC